MHGEISDFLKNFLKYRRKLVIVLNIYEYLGKIVNYYFCSIFRREAWMIAFLVVGGSRFKLSIGLLLLLLLLF